MMAKPAGKARASVIASKALRPGEAMPEIATKEGGLTSHKAAQLFDLEFLAANARSRKAIHGKRR